MSSTYDLARYEQLEIGQRAAFSKTLSEADISHFVAITGDVNPLHVDREFARETFFRSRIAHGVLAGSLISTVIGTRLPGAGAIYRSQSFEFHRPARIGDTLTAWVEIEAVDADAEAIDLLTGVDNQRGERVVSGRAEVTLLRA